jgi:hypothetical protein
LKDRFSSGLCACTRPVCIAQLNLFFQKVPDASPRRLAQAGGRNPEKLPEALALVEKLLTK